MPDPEEEEQEKKRRVGVLDEVIANAMVSVVAYLLEVKNSCYRGT
jgi:hypothetical protein